MEIKKENIIEKSLPVFNESFFVPDDLKQMLGTANGFFCLGDSIHFYPYSNHELSLVSINNSSGWKGLFPEATNGLTFFAQDILACQYGYDKEGNYFKYDIESGFREYYSDNLWDLISRIDADPEQEGGETILKKWESENGKIEKGNRLMAKMPFLFGGGFEASNLVSVETMIILNERTSMARDFSIIPSGSMVKINTCG